MRSLSELHEFIQDFHTIEELENAFSAIFESDEANETEKRLAQGKHGKLFKLAREELKPLIHWMKNFAPKAKGRVIDGSQPYDAEVKCDTTEPEIRLEFGSAGRDHQAQMRLEHLTKNGRTDTFATYERNESKSVEQTTPSKAVNGRKVMQEVAEELDAIAKKKSKKTYDCKTFLVLFHLHDKTIDADLVACLKKRAQKIIDENTWTVAGVFIMSDRNGPLATNFPDPLVC